MRAALLAIALALAMAAPASAAPSLVKIGDFSQPVHVASPPNDPRVFVVEKGGLVKIVGAGTFLDARSMTNSSGEEQGLLSIAFPPNYAASGLFYVFLTAGDNSLRVLEFRRSADPNRADPRGQVVLSIPHPGEQNHNGGQLQFGPDGYLYVGTGDGGGAGDPGNDAQTLGNNELGKILRIVPHTGAAAPGNPFGSRVWSYGLRNPWRFTFDRAAPHDLLIGDVGQDEREEIDWARAPGLGRGVNFGWACREGLIAYSSPPGPCAASPVNPVFDLRHDAGFHAVVGGYVVRDPGLPTLRGRYLYGDTYQPTLYSVALPNTGNRAESALRIQTLSSFGEDACGRIYAASLNGPVYRLQDGAPTPCGAAAAPDRTAPTVNVSILGAKKALKKRRLLVRVRCSEACRASVGTRLLKVKRLKTRHRSIAAGQRVTVKVKLYKKVAKKLRRRVNRKGFVRIGVTVRATDLAGNTSVKRRHGRIRRR